MDQTIGLVSLSMKRLLPLIWTKHLNDNSQGFNNYSAPGADRLKITLSLFKKGLDNFNDDNFVELGTVVNGVLRTKTKKGVFGTGSSGNSNFDDVLARRTFDESGELLCKTF